MSDRNVLVPTTGERYLTRRYPAFGDADLCEVEVTGIVHLGDGATVVRYRLNDDYGDIRYKHLKDFWENTEVKNES